MGAEDRGSETRAASTLEPARWWPLAISLLVGAGIWFAPVPDGVDPKAWHLLAIFVGTVAGFIAKPLPMGAVAIIGITLTVLTSTLEIGVALSGFGNSTIWLIAVAFFVSRAFIKTGLGARIAYLFMKALGRRTLGLAYGLGITDLVLAPAMPSNTARAGGVITPLLLSVARAYGSDPDDGTGRRIGAFLFANAFQFNAITSAMFMTAMAANPLIARLAGEAGVEITWGGWFLAALAPGLVSMAVVPLLVYKLYPPEIRETPAARDMAVERLAAMGPVSCAEWATLAVFVLLLVLWVGGKAFSIDATTAAFAGLAVLLLVGVLTWQDILAEKSAWDTVVWFAALVMMATQLSKLGLVTWLGESMSAQVEGLDWTTAFSILALAYFYSHYLFASQTAHISAMYALFLTVSIAVGAPAALAALVLAFFSNLFSTLTHYANGPAPVLYGTGFVPMGAWWGIGALVSMVNIAIWVGVGSIWWRVIGLL